MKRIKMRALLTSLVLLPAAFFAQYDGLFTQYMFNEVFINPAYAGSKEAMSATLLNRQQWVSFPGRPVTTSMSLHGPLKDGKMGAGLSILNEKIGVLNRNLIYGTYAYRLKLDERSTLAMGLMAGIDNQLNRLGQVKVGSDGSPADPQFTQHTPNVFAPNAGAGVYYNNAQFYAGLSVPRLIDNSVRFSPSGATIKTTRVSPSKFTYYFTGGYLFRLQEDLKMRANMMIKVVNNAPAQFDLGANFLIRDVIWAGMSYRSASAISALLGAQVNKQFFVCYWCIYFYR
jgi:type IX secretion system PorP/SprF family membrane protein